jgi:putative peptide zinc metalloprotease protein
MNGASRICLHDLVMRRDGDEWIVGRLEIREFVALPDQGARAVELLGQGLSVEETGKALSVEYGEEVDVAAFVEELIGLGFVAEADGQALPQPKAAPPSFPRLLPEHVRFALSPALAVLIGGLLLAAIVVLLRRPDLMPDYRSLLWSPRGSFVIGLTFVAGWSLVFVHELAHLVTARAAGVPARITLGTRLQFLVAQTDISGIEVAPRRERLTAYLAGMAVNVMVAALALFALAAMATGTTAHRLLAFVMVLALLQLPYQFLVFMRTDVYFVLQELTRCRDLHGDGRAYVRYMARRLTRRNGGAADPSLDLPPHERRAVRAYSVVLVAGTALCLAAMAAFTLPADLIVLGRAVSRLRPGHDTATYTDSVVVVLVLGGLHAVWLRTWWRDLRAQKQPRRGWRT